LKTAQSGYDRITTTIEREWLAQIIAGTKKIEYRQIRPYWTKRFAKVSMPFELRLLNGMNPPVPEVTVLIHRITKDRRAGEYRLHIKKVMNYKHWDKRLGKPLEPAQGHLKFPLPIPFVSCPNDNSQLWRRLWENQQRRRRSTPKLSNQRAEC